VQPSHDEAVSSSADPPSARRRRSEAEKPRMVS
jgi:hypothetical protein